MIIQSSKVWIASQFIGAQLEIFSGKITNVYAYNQKKCDIDYNDLRIVPGFYDIHTHGYDGYDTNDATQDGLKNWLKEITKEGVCGLCPTTITQSSTVLINAVGNVASVVEKGYEGAEILGIHFEGPYLDMVYKGAQPEQFISKGSIEGFKEFQNSANGLIKIITLAPEHDEDFALTKYCSQNGVVVSMGHSSSSFELAQLAVANGANSFTHIYNGMSGYGHRDNGLVGAAMSFKNVFGEIICDGNHSSYAALKIMFDAKGPDHSIMITDSLMCKCKPVGSQFKFGGNDIEIYPDGSAHLMQGKKSLAGSTLKVNEGLKILVEKANVSFESALNSCTLNPCRLLNIDDHKGYLKVGYDADIVVLNDDYSVQQTYCKGKRML